MNEEKIIVIHESGIQYYDRKSLKIELAGQKTVGLLEIPIAWRLPFFVIGKDVSESFMKKNKTEKVLFCNQVCNYVRKCLYVLGKNNNKFILRSSGEVEGMNERGKYDSCVANINELEDCMYSLFKNLKKQGNQAIAYVVQPYVERIILGHLSNERRVSQEMRDWLVEYEGIERAPYRIGVRKWRTKFKYDTLIEDDLLCEVERNIKKELRKVAYYYTEFKREKRVHIEFVWNGKRVYLVQNDFEINNSCTCNPQKFDIHVDNIECIENMRIFRKISAEDAIYYRKVRNVVEYEKLGLPIAPLYILDDKSVIKKLAQGIISEDLKYDLSLFGQKSIVIRTDICVEEKEKAILLPRSNELRNYTDIVQWCTENLEIIIPYNRVAILVHIFIPAISAAFAYSEPNNRAVTIQSLWGLPEGLYYNAHDTFLLDTGSKSVDHIQEEKVIISSIQRDYKAVYIAPNSEGKWMEKYTMPPYDWKESISERQAKKIAVGSRLIAQKTGSAVSIMWFVGVDNEYYHTDCIPWYHEVCGVNTFSHEIYCCLAH